MESFILLLARYVPFWAAPLMLINIGLFITLRKQGKKSLSNYAVIIALFAGMILALYFLAGGPRDFVLAVQEML